MVTAYSEPPNPYDGASIEQLATSLVRAIGRQNADVRQVSRRDATVDHVDTTHVASTYLEMRRRRDIVCNEQDYFADPAWDILIDLFIARGLGKRVSVSSACIGSAVPATTALRYIKAMTDRELIHRICDRDDGRRVYLCLDDDIADRLNRYFQRFGECMGAALTTSHRPPQSP
jgi:hypothetical protein